MELQYKGKGIKGLDFNHEIHSKCKEYMIRLAISASKQFPIFHGQRTSRESFFFQKFETFGLGQTNWAEILGGILAISSQTIGTILAL